MKIKVIDEKSDVYIAGVFERENLNPYLNTIDKKLNDELSRISKDIKEGDYKLINTQGRINTKAILLIGLGDKKEFNSEKLRKCCAKAGKMLRGDGYKHFSTEMYKILDNGITPVVEGFILGLYEFKKYVTVDKDKIKKVESLTLINADEKQVKKSSLIANNVNYIRDLVNESAEVVTPEYLAKEAQLQGKNLGFKVTVFDKKKIKELGMNALLAVGRGSIKEPRFIIMEYNGGKGKPMIFVGKGITFDSGGLDVKPASYMENMYSDMAGAATVLATIKTAAELKLNKNIVGIIPTCENFIGPDSFRQGDILKAYNGKTIEVWHTDAEGRLILADGLSYADKHFDGEGIIDIATLTGAAVYALGYEITSLVSTNQTMKEKVLAAAKDADEYTWELPIIDEYKELVKGSAGDVRNMSTESAGPGTITAGIFLSHFVEKHPWVHLDIGASGWSPSDKAYKKKGGTGVCLRTFIKFLEK